jgi:hypothetical protein
MKSKGVALGINHFVNIHVFMDVLVLLRGKAEVIRMGIVLVPV